jgi:replicative DNA helicase
MQLMTTKAQGERHLEVGTMARDLKMLAKSEQIPIVALSQMLNRTLGMPTKHMLRESGEIAMHLDLLLLVHREEEEMPSANNRGLAKIGISGRSVRSGQIDMAYLGDYALFKGLTMER